MLGEVSGIWLELDTKKTGREKDKTVRRSDPESWAGHQVTLSKEGPEIPTQETETRSLNDLLKTSQIEGP